MQASRMLIRSVLRVAKPRVPLMRMTCANMSAKTTPSAYKGTMAQKLTEKAKSDGISAQFLFPPGATLPYKCTWKDGTDIRIENIPEDRAERAWALLKDAIAVGEGYSKDELEPLEEFIENTRNKKGYFHIVHEHDDDTLAVIILVPCPFARSLNTVHFAGPCVINPKYRSKGYGRDLLYQSYTELGRVILGHPGFPSGRTVIGKSLNALVATGSTMTGIVPMCTYLQNIGWVNDIITCGLNPKLISKSLLALPKPIMSPLMVTEPVPKFMQPDNPPITEFPEMVLNGHNLKVELAGPEDVWRVEEILRQSALDSEGFAIDEFDSDGRFSRKLFFDCNIVVAKTTDNVIIGTALFGPTRFCRSFNKKQVGGYIHINKDFRRKGLGDAFLKYLMKMGRQAGYKSILTDVFASNNAGQNLLMKNDYTNTGTLPHSGYINDSGYMDGHLYWRAI